MDVTEGGIMGAWWTKPLKKTREIDCARRCWKEWRMKAEPFTGFDIVEVTGDLDLRGLSRLEEMVAWLERVQTRVGGAEAGWCP